VQRYFIKKIKGFLSGNQTIELLLIGQQSKSAEGMAVFSIDDFNVRYDFSCNDRSVQMRRLLFDFIIRTFVPFVKEMMLKKLLK